MSTIATPATASTVYVALDLETTGLDPARDAIIEVGAVKFDDTRELDRFGTLVRPGRQIPIQISQLTGITDRDVLDAPPFAAVKAKLAQFVGQATVVGHNVGFDLGFLKKQGCLTANHTVDTLALATVLLPNQNRYSLGKLVDGLGIEFPTRHRALDDAVATMQLFWALMERARRLPSKVLVDLNRIASKSRWPLQEIFQEAERRQAQAEPLASPVGEGPEVPARPRPPSAPEPLQPVQERTMLDVVELAAMLEQDGAFSRAFEGFEYRPQQVEMLCAVAEALNTSQHLLVEAGTGVGKSIAYLLPALHWAVQNGERIVVSTNTINLQDQLYTKDIPDLRALLPFEVRAALLKGRSNYLCLRRLHAFQDRLDKVGNPTDEELTVLARILAWLPQTTTGDRSELVQYGAREQEIWSGVSADADSCTGTFCPFFRQNKCYFYAARQAAESAHLIIVNHALLLSDVATENRVLPAYSYLIVDEAHHLESATTYQLGHAMTKRNILRLLEQIGHSDIGLVQAPVGGYLGSVLGRCRGRVPQEQMGEVEDCVLSLYESIGRLIRGQHDLFEDLTAFVCDQLGDSGPYDQRLRLSRELRLLPEWEQIEVVWANQSDDLEATIVGLSHLLDLLRDLSEYEILGHADMVQDGTALLRQLGTVYGHLESVLMDSDRDSVSWIRVHAGQRNKGVEEVSLCAVPLRVDDLVEQHLLWPKEAVIFTSATLRTGGDFSFIKERLGARDAHELAVGSPFDYESQVLLYLPTDIPEPNEPYHQQRMNQSLLELALATRGRMLGLFTSYSQLRAASSAISGPLGGRGITVYTQGQGASRSQLLESFRETPQSVLLGTRSFWEGVDVPGDALSCLVIGKLPFAVPSDPVFAARSEEMDDPFYQYMVPDAILNFRQGFGRLIRTKADRGVVVVMDKRLQSKRYGELFLESLPCCTVIRGTLADLPQSAAMWIDEGRSMPGMVEQSPGSEDAGPELAELEYVSFDDLD